MLNKQTKKDYIFTALANMGNASHHMALANTCVEDVPEVSPELMAEMKNINAEIHRLQEKIREIRNAISG